MKRRQFMVGAGILICRPAVSFAAAAEQLSITDFPEARYGQARPKSVDEVIDLYDLEAAARHALPRAHYGYIATGSGWNRTLRANIEAFERFGVRARRLVDVAKIDTAMELFGVTYPSPIGLCPVSSQRAFHSEGEEAAAKGAKERLQILSTFTTAGIEDVNRARTTPAWFQLYPSGEWEVARSLVKRALRAGTNVIVLTVDAAAGLRQVTMERSRKEDPRDCGSCHEASVAGFLRRKSMFEGITAGSDLRSPQITWDFIRKVKGIDSAVKVVVKGIMTKEDAELSLLNGADAVMVSNHGGRQEDSGFASLMALSEVADAANGRMPVLFDGGIRSGADAYKALALGADAVCVGRPYVWGLAAFGQAGVEKAFKILQRDLEDMMKLCGTPAVASITRAHIQAL